MERKSCGKKFLTIMVLGTDGEEHGREKMIANYVKARLMSIRNCIKVMVYGSN